MHGTRHQIKKGEPTVNNGCESGDSGGRRYFGGARGLQKNRAREAMAKEIQWRTRLWARARTCRCDDLLDFTYTRLAVGETRRGAGRIACAVKTTCGGVAYIAACDSRLRRIGRLGVQLYNACGWDVCEIGFGESGQDSGGTVVSRSTLYLHSALPSSGRRTERVTTQRRARRVGKLAVHGPVRFLTVRWRYDTIVRRTVRALV